MPITEAEAVANLRILVKVAQADGTIHDEEKKALEAALEGVPLPSGTTVASLVTETIDLDAELAKLTSPEAKDAAFKGAFAMANADGNCSPEEEKVLAQIAEKLRVTNEQKSLLKRLLDEGKDTVLPSNIQPIEDAAKRATAIRRDVIKYAVISAALGAFPIPGLAIATDIGIIAVQVKMIRDIGQYYGHKVDRKAAKSMLYGLGLGTGIRMAVNNIAKLFPGWGSAVGAATSFAGTWALGKTMEKFFAEGAKADIASLKDDFKAAEKEGKAAYAENKEAVAKKESETKAALAALAQDLKDGKIDQGEYEKRLAELS